MEDAVPPTTPPEKTGVVGGAISNSRLYPGIKCNLAALGSLQMHTTAKIYQEKFNPEQGELFAQRPIGFTEAEAASYLGLKVYTLRKWRREGSGPEYIRCGARLIRYMQADIDSWLGQRKFQSNAHELSATFKK